MGVVDIFLRKNGTFLTSFYIVQIFWKFQPKLTKIAKVEFNDFVWTYSENSLTRISKGLEKKFELGSFENFEILRQFFFQLEMA